MLRIPGFDASNPPAGAEHEMNTSKLEETDAGSAVARLKAENVIAQNNAFRIVNRNQAAIISRLRRELVGLNAAHLALREEQQRLECDYRNALTAQQQLQTRYDRILRSRSWRLTGPLRLIGAQLRHAIGVWRR